MISKICQRGRRNVAPPNGFFLGSTIVHPQRCQIHHLLVVGVHIHRTMSVQVQPKRRRSSTGHVRLPSPPRLPKDSVSSPSTPRTNMSSSPSQSSFKTSSRRSQSPAQRLNCAFRAMQCSSRAVEDEQQQQQQQHSTRATDDRDESPWSELPTKPRKEEGAFPVPVQSFVMKSHLKKASPIDASDKRRSSGSLGDYESDGTVSVLLGLSSIEDDHSPFEHATIDDEDVSPVPFPPPSSPLTPSTSGRRSALDPPETPNISNRATARAPQVTMPLPVTVPDPTFDELCQQNFNTAPKTWLQKGSLGDAITPQLSPEQYSSDESNSDSTRGGLPATRTAMLVPAAASYRGLEIPTMPHTPYEAAPRSRPDASIRNSITSYASSVSQLYGELLLASDMKVEYPEDSARPDSHDPFLTAVIPAKAAVPQAPLPTKEETALPHDSPFSSVSTFVDIPIGQDESNQKPRQDLSSRPPFFWRSHPSVTVYSYNNSHQTHKSHSRSPDDEKEIFTSSYTSFPNKRRSSIGLDQPTMQDLMGNKNPNQGFNHPAVILRTLVSIAGNKLPSLFVRSEK